MMANSRIFRIVYSVKDAFTLTTRIESKQKYNGNYPYNLKKKLNNLPNIYKSNFYKAENVYFWAELFFFTKGIISEI